MKKIITGLSILAALFASVTYADVQLEDNAKILGKWKVNAESLGLDKEKKAIKVSWEFQKNGVLLTKGEDSLGRTQEMDIAIKYSVENGVIKKQSTPGREKYEDCVVVDLSAKDMTLKCRALYFFMTRN
jgi:3-hydroxyacyl-CoA dehydrogenase